MSCEIDLHSLTDDEKEKLIKDCTVIPEETEYGQKDGVFCCEVVNNKVYIPYSYVYHNLTKHYKVFPNENIKFTKWSNEVNFVIDLFPRQLEVLPEILNVLRETNVVSINLTTGYGKTFLAIHIAWRLKYQTLFTVFRENLIRQTKESIITACPNAKIQILDSKCEMKPDMNFFLISTESLTKRSRSDYKNIGLFIIDEYHTILSSVYSKILLHVTPKYLVGLTATPYTSNGLGDLVNIFFGYVFVYRSLYQPYNVYIINSEFKPQVKTTKIGRVDWNDILKQQCSDYDRNLLIVDIVKYFQARNILILVKRIEHSINLLNMMKEENIDVDKFSGNQKEYRYDCRVLITTYSKGGVGFDAPKLDMLIIAGDVDSQFIQYLGRVFRKNGCPIVVDIKDNFPTLKKHMSNRFITYLTTGGEIRNFKSSFPEFDEWRGYEKYHPNLKLILK